jgi:hypothetical protein
MSIILTVVKQKVRRKSKAAIKAIDRVTLDVPIQKETKMGTRFYDVGLKRNSED